MYFSVAGGINKTVKLSVGWGWSSIPSVSNSGVAEVTGLVLSGFTVYLKML